MFFFLYYLLYYFLCFFQLRLSLDGLVLGLESGLVGLLRGVHGLASVLLARGGLGVQLGQLKGVELGALEDLALANVHVLKRIDALGLLLDLAANRLSNELLEDLSQVAGGSFSCHDVGHLLADLFDLGGVGVASNLSLVRAALGEANGEDSKVVAVRGLDVDTGLNRGLPLAHEGLVEVRGEGHAMEVGEDLSALNILSKKVNDAVSAGLVLVEVA